MSNGLTIKSLDERACLTLFLFPHTKDLWVGLNFIDSETRYLSIAAENKQKIIDFLMQD